jgi:sRNA-binding protein
VNSYRAFRKKSQKDFLAGQNCAVVVRPNLRYGNLTSPQYLVAALPALTAIECAPPPLNKLFSLMIKECYGA